MAALEIGQTLPGVNSPTSPSSWGADCADPPGRAAAAVGLILPGAAILAVLGLLYARFHDNPGCRRRPGRGRRGRRGAPAAGDPQDRRQRSFLNLRDLAFMLATFLMVGLLHVSLPATLFILAPIAVWLHRPEPAGEAAPPRPAAEA